MKVVFMGTPDFAVPTLLAIAGHGHDIAAVISECQCLIKRLIVSGSDKSTVPAKGRQLINQCLSQSLGEVVRWPIETLREVGQRRWQSDRTACVEDYRRGGIRRCNGVAHGAEIARATAL